jgi:hypothetical protein
LPPQLVAFIASLALFSCGVLKVSEKLKHARDINTNISQCSLQYIGFRQYHEVLRVVAGLAAALFVAHANRALTNGLVLYPLA